MKNLIPVKFTFETSSNPDSQEAMCPSCKKVLSNNTLIYRMSILMLSFMYTYNFHLVVAKPCAHVTCKTCTDTLVRPAKQCVVCDTPLKLGDDVHAGKDGKGDKAKKEKGDKNGKGSGDIIELKREGELIVMLVYFLFPYFNSSRNRFRRWRNG